MMNNNVSIKPLNHQKTVRVEVTHTSKFRFILFLLQESPVITL